MATATTWTKARSILANAIKEHGQNSPEAVEARRNFNALRTEEYLRKVLSAAPPLSDAQRAKLAELLRPARQPGAGIGAA